MDNVVDLNSSVISSASAISAIGLESTMTEEFQELKAFQVEVANQVDRVVDYFERVKDIVIDELQMGADSAWSNWRRSTRKDTRPWRCYPPIIRRQQ